MKNKLYFIITTIISLLLFSSTVYANEQNYFVNENDIEFTEEKYENFIKLGFSHEDINNMSKELYDSYEIMDKVELDKTQSKYYRETIIRDNNIVERVVIEEISKDEYELEVPPSKLILGLRTTITHETTYKKLTMSSYAISSSLPNRRAVLSTLEWKIMPSTRSYDIFAGRVTNGEIVLNSYSGTMTSTETKFDYNCGISGTQNYTVTYSSGGGGWNIQNATIGHTGVGFTSKLSTGSAVCTNDLGIYVSVVLGINATLSFQSVVGANAYVSYQHATSSVSYSSVYNTYSFSNSGLGHVIYFSNSGIMSSYDGMAGLSMTL